MRNRFNGHGNRGNNGLGNVDDRLGYSPVAVAVAVAVPERESKESVPAGPATIRHESEARHDLVANATPHRLSNIIPATSRAYSGCHRSYPRSQIQVFRYERHLIQPWQPRHNGSNPSTYDLQDTKLSVVLSDPVDVRWVAGRSTG